MTKCTYCGFHPRYTHDSWFVRIGQSVICKWCIPLIGGRLVESAQ